MSYYRHLDAGKIVSIFNLAGFTVTDVQQAVNEYWPATPEYEELHRSEPWWLVGTELGNFKVGWRKRVINLDWESTQLKIDVSRPGEQFTNDETHAHASGYGRLIVLLERWREAVQSRAGVYG